MDKISVILPVYNVEKYIRRCLDSIVNQTYRNLEIILVDDGSSDGSGEICDDYTARDNRIKIIHKSNSGAPAARNDALAIATGEWIAYVDPDDWLELDEFEEVMNIALKDNPDIILFNAFMNINDVETEWHSFPSDFITEDNNVIKELQSAALDKHYAPFNQICNQSYPWDKIYKRSVMEKHNVRWPVKLKANDDIVYIIQAFQFAKKVAYINKPLYHYRINESSITQKYNPARPQIDHDIYVEMIKLGKEFELGDEYYEALYARILVNTRLCCGRCFFNPSNHDFFPNKMKGLSGMLQDNIIRTAFCKADRSKLDKVERLMALFKTPSPIWVYLIYEMYRFKHDILHW